MEWFVWLFNFLNPHVEWIKLFFNQIIEIIGSVENTVDGSHKEREESKSHKFQSNGENIFIWCRTSIISISDSCDNFENPIKRENILRMVWLIIETTFKDPWLGAITVWRAIAFVEFSKVQPDTGHYVASVNNVKDKSREWGKIILSFLRIFLECTTEHKLQRLRKSSNMSHSKDLQPIVAKCLSHHQFWNSSCNIKEEVPKNVILSNTFDLFMSSSFLEHVQNDFHKINDINDQFNLVKSWLLNFFFCIANWVSFRIFFSTFRAIFINIAEH